MNKWMKEMSLFTFISVHQGLSSTHRKFGGLILRSSSPHVNTELMMFKPSVCEGECTTVWLKLIKSYVGEVHLKNTQWSKAAQRTVFSLTKDRTVREDEEVSDVNRFDWPGLINQITVTLTEELNWVWISKLDLFLASTVMLAFIFCGIFAFVWESVEKFTGEESRRMSCSKEHCWQVLVCWRVASIGCKWVMCLPLLLYYSLAFVSETIFSAETFYPVNLKNVAFNDLISVLNEMTVGKWWWTQRWQKRRNTTNAISDIQSEISNQGTVHFSGFIQRQSKSSNFDLGVISSHFKRSSH